jgi:hypothetical protein
MRDAGWIRRARNARPTVADRESRRRTYEITRDGRAILAAEVSRLELLLEQARAQTGGPIGSR